MSLLQRTVLTRSIQSMKYHAAAFKCLKAQDVITVTGVKGGGSATLKCSVTPNLSTPWHAHLQLQTENYLGGE